MGVGLGCIYASHHVANQQCRWFYLFGFWAVGGLGFTNVTHHVKILTLPMVLPFRVFRCGGVAMILNTSHS